MKVIAVDGQYYIKQGKMLKKVSLEQAIDALIEELRGLNIEHIYKSHDEGD